LATGRHVAAAEVGDRRDTREFGEVIRVADLLREVQWAIRPVSYRLPVPADRGHIGRRNFRCGQKLEDGCTCESAERGIGASQAVEIVVATLTQVDQPISKLWGERPGCGADEFDTVVDPQQGEIQPVDARA
jgi:hypothetical protein